MTKIKNIGKSVLITVIFIILMGVLSSAPIMILDSQNVSNPFQYMSIVAIIADIILLGLFFLLRKKHFVNVISLKKVSARSYLLPALAGFSFALWAGLFVPMSESSTTAYESIMQGNILIIFIQMIIFQPLIEEFIFRGILISNLRKSLSSGVCVIISSVVFACVHASAVGLSWLPIVFVIGFICAVTYEKTRSLLPSIVAHSAANLPDFFKDNLKESPDIVLTLIFIFSILVAIISIVGIMRMKPNKQV